MSPNCAHILTHKSLLRLISTECGRSFLLQFTIAFRIHSARACWTHCYPCLCTCVFVCFCIRLYEKMWTFFEYEIKNNNEFESLEQIPCRLFFIRLNFAFYFIYIFHFLFQVVLFILFLELKFVFHHIREVSISIFIFCFFFVQTIFSLLWHCVSQLDYSNEKKLSCISLFKCHSIFFFFTWTNIFAFKSSSFIAALFLLHRLVLLFVFLCMSKIVPLLKLMTFFFFLAKWNLHIEYWLVPLVYFELKFFAPK